MNDLWWYKQPWSYKNGSFYEEHIVAVIEPSKWIKLNYQAVYLPFIYKHEGNKLRKVFISEYD